MDDLMRKFHAIWSLAVGTPGYDKKEWMRLQALLEGDDPRVLKAECYDCGLPYQNFGLDLLVPRSQWLEIINLDPPLHPEDPNNDGGLLCASCIVKRAGRLGGSSAVHAVIEFASAR